MRKILYILPLLLLVILPYKVYSQSPTPMWQYFCMGNTCALTFSTQLIYSFNITSNFTSANAQFIQFTVPEQVLQQQLYYCKTYDPFVTNNVSPSQCEFAWPAVVAITYPNGTVINYWTEYQLTALSYDNTTGLPQTLEFPINIPDQGINGITLSPGTYYIYAYYTSPFLFNANSIQGLSIPSCGSGYNGGWCGGTLLYPIRYASTTYYYFSRTIWSGNGISLLKGQISRTLNVSYNPAYPVIIGANPGLEAGTSYVYGYPQPYSYYDVVIFTATSSSQSKSINVCIVPNTYSYSGCNIVLGPGFYDLRQVLINSGYNPSQYNVISNISVLATGTIPGSGCEEMVYLNVVLILCPYMSGIYLEYTPVS